VTVVATSDTGVQLADLLDYVGAVWVGILAGLACLDSVGHPVIVQVEVLGFDGRTDFGAW